MAFFEPLRVALRVYAEGVHLVGDPASPGQLGAAEARLGMTIPEGYAAFLRSFDGASLYHELLTLHDCAHLSAAGGQLCIGDGPEGAYWMDEAGVIRLVDPEGPDPIIAGTSFERWLSSTLAREDKVHDREGEVREVVDAEGALFPAMRRKRARIGRQKDPAAALPHLEEAELHLEEHETEAARQELEAAVKLDPAAGPAWELLASLHVQAGAWAEAEAASLRAAASTPTPWLRAARLLDAAQAAQAQQSPTDAAPRARALAHATAALAADPAHVDLLLGRAREALAEGARDEAEHLARRLDLLDEAGLAPTPSPALASLRRDLRTRQALRVLDNSQPSSPDAPLPQPHPDR